MTRALRVAPRLEAKGFAEKGVDIEEDAPRLGLLVNFDYNQSSIKRDSVPRLQALARALTQDLPNVVILIGGHTDIIGGPDYNQGLSEQRAEVVRAFLSAQGVPEERLRTQGYSLHHPICGNDTERHRAWNRRVEFMTVGVLDANGREVRTLIHKPGDHKQGSCDDPV